MTKPKQCPKCVAFNDEIQDVEEASSFLGIDSSESQKWLCGRCGHFFDDESAEMENWHDAYDLSEMKLSQIADIVIDDWKNMPPKAWHYVEAMMNIDDITDRFGYSDGKEIISYFLINAQGWQGTTARKVKKHLNGLLKKD